MANQWLPDDPNPMLGSASNPINRVVPFEDLGELIRAKRHMERLTLSEAARQCGVSAATLSRWERQGGRQSLSGMQTERGPQAPDMRTVAAIAKWLGVTIGEVMDENPPPVPDVLELHLRADPNLDVVTAAKLSKMFRLAYAQALKESNKKENDTNGSPA